MQQDYFTSSDFYEVVAKLKSSPKYIEHHKNFNQDTVLAKAMQDLISMTFLYVRLNEKALKVVITDFLNEVVDKYTNNPDPDNKFKQVAYKVMARRFVNKNELDVGSEETIKIITERLSKEYKYHAFNSADLESIQTNGIDPNASQDYQDELDRINDLFMRKGAT